MPVPDRLLPVAMFDSGVGGLTVLHECLVSLPEEDFVYFGDTARFPYGDRTPEELRSFALEVSDLLLAEGVKLLVVACNSATAAALPALRERLADRLGVVGVVRPESRLAARATANGQVGLLATPATVASGAYAREVAAVAPEVSLTQVPCPDLATLIQRDGEIDQELVDDVELSCRPLTDAGVDTVILGCTHYGLIRPLLQRTLGRGVAIVSSGQAMAGEVEGELAARGLETAGGGGRGAYRFLCSGDPERFRVLGTRFLQLPLGSVERVAVSEAGRRPAGAVA